MLALVCVDGTSMSFKMDPDRYDEVMRISHTRTVYHRWPDGSNYCEYFRGPTIEGSGTRRIAEQAAESARKRRRLPGVTGLFMVGHSRGCAAIIEAAKILGNQNITVEFMGFFDAVDMSTAVNATVVPANVYSVRHARRDPRGRSRPMWGNCGTLMAAVLPLYHQKFFYCTHGAVGGTPYSKDYEDSNGYILEVGEHLSTKITVDDDLKETKMVWDYMWEGINVARQWYGHPALNPTKPGNRYTVVSGDNLSLIADKFWHDALFWPILYDSNKAVVGSNHNLIKPGQVLTIPDIRQYSPSQLNNIRVRGLKWR